MKTNTLYKMKYLFPILITFILLGCKQEKTNSPKIRYTGYYTKAEGGHINIKIDSISTIEKLIPRLIDNHELYETGKDYWIGYAKTIDQGREMRRAKEKELFKEFSPLKNIGRGIE